jgi:nucleoside-diphosphate-sugar epimerase
MKTRVLVTGASGFIGRSLCERLQEAGFWVRAAVRTVSNASKGDEQSTVGEIGPDTDWSKALEGIDVVVHLAARVHVMRETADRPQDEFRRVNRDGTERLALQAVSYGVKRFIFMSTLKVNGEETPFDASGNIPAFREDDIPAPQDAYAISKWEAELVLQKVCRDTGLAFVIVRSPLVYGPGVKANFFRLIKLVKSGLPLPFGKVKNSRSFIFLDNLADCLVHCCTDTRALNQLFLISDGNDLSTPQLLQLIAGALNKKNSLWNVPVALLRFLGKITGKGDEVSRMIGSLRADTRKVSALLNWKPPYSVEEAIRLTVGGI